MMWDSFDTGCWQRQCVFVEILISGFLYMEVDFDEVSSMGRRFHSVYGVMEFIIIYVGLREFKCFFFLECT